MIKKIKKNKLYKKIRKYLTRSKFIATQMAKIKLMTMKPEKKNELETLIKNHNPGKTLTPSELRRTCVDILYHDTVYNITKENYYCFQIWNKTDAEKAEFVSTREKTRAVKSLIKKYPPSDWNFRDKYATYEKLAKFYKRDIIKVDNSFDRDTFAEFASTHDDFFVKENRGALGAGVYAIHMKRETRTIDEIFNEVLLSAPCIIEERIVQHHDMAVFHPSSVNTIRFVTYWAMSGELRHVYANIRIGQGGAVVDNAGAGGIIASVDLKTGVINTDGYSEDHENAMVVHPDTQYPFKGSQIPAWDELLEMVNEMAEISKVRWYVGWDFAYSDRGWMVIEGNDNPGIIGPQMTFQKGIRPLFTETVLERKLNKDEIDFATYDASDDKDN